MVVYKTTNLLNGKFYVGKDKYNNPSYLGSGKRFQIALKKYGSSNFKKEILEYCTEDTVDEREIYWIKETNAIQEGYNISTGGTGGDLGSLVNAKRALSLTGKVQSKEAIEKRKKSLEGREVTWGDKIRESMTGKTWKQSAPRSNEHRMKLSAANKGKEKSLETRKKLSKANKGKSPGNKGKYYHKGKYYDYETYLTLSDNPRKILDYEEISKLRTQGELWKDIGPLFGYHPDVVRQWFKKQISSIY